jgi:hypothetical protein
MAYFGNHLPERWQTDKNILCLDVNETDYSWLLHLHNFKPSLTLFYRPELYPEHYLRTLGGLKIAFLSEPLPAVRNGKLDMSPETELRMRVYANMAWEAYDWCIFYDRGKRASVEILRYPIDEYRALPIDTSFFNPVGRPKRPHFDVCFIGKPTAHRIWKMDFLRTGPLKFIWIAHGYHGRMLASLFRRSKIVLNIHADAKEAFEPRVYLAAASGALVLSEPLSSTPDFFRDRIVQDDRIWNNQILREYIDAESSSAKLSYDADIAALSVRSLLQDLFDRLSTARTL